MRGCNPSRYISKHSVESFNSKHFYPESVALFLDDESFYHTSIPHLTIFISSKQQFKPKTQHMLHYLKDTETKHLITRTESCKVILPNR